MHTAQWYSELFARVRASEGFSVWCVEPDKYGEELDSLFSPSGIVWQQWPAVVEEYNQLVALGKQAADFALAYGFPPDNTERTLLALAIAQPYAAQKRWHQTMRAVGVAVGRFVATADEVGESQHLAQALRSLMYE